MEENSTWQTTAWCNEESYLNACRDAGIEHPVGMCFQDAGWKNGPWLGSGKNTKSNIVSKSIAGSGGNATYRGKVDIKKSAINSEAMVKCDSLILDDKSMSDTIPVNAVGNISSNIEHEATVSKISDDVLFYLMSRGIPEERATELIVLGFIDEFKEELPMEYAVELNQLIKRNL